MTEEIEIRPVDTVPWTDTEIVFGTRGDPAGCWCQYFKLSNAEWQQRRGPEGRALCAAELRSQVERADPTPGLLAYLDGDPVGWVAVEPRPNYPQLARTRVVAIASAEQHDDASVWAISCFVVRTGFRRRGISRHLIRAAVEHARAHGARLIEGYPVDVAAKPRVSSAELYHGTLNLFEAAGFTVDARPTPGRALVTMRF